MLFGKLFTNPKMWVNGDADDITMGGVYTCKDVQNVPTGDGALFVFKTENTVKQVFIPVGEEGVVYTRVLGEEWASVTGTSEETQSLIQSAIDKANQAQAKADTVDTRLNNIIVESGTSEAEVVAARTDSNGKTFTTLGQRLDTQFNEIKEDLDAKVDLKGVGQVTTKNIEGMTEAGAGISDNLFPKATIVANGKYVAGIGGITGKAYLMDAQALDTYIIPVDGVSTYTFTNCRTAIVVSDLEYTPVGELLTYTTSVDSAGGKYILFSFNPTTYPINSYSITKPVPKYTIPSNWIIPDEGNLKKPIDSTSGTGTLNIVGRSALKDGELITFKGFFDTFSEFSLNFYGSTITNYIKVDATNITIKNNTSMPTPQAHGLTIQNDVTLAAQFIDGTVKITLYSNGELWTSTLQWYQTNGTVTQPQIAPNGMTFTSAILTVSYDAVKRSIWYFGDSYTGITSPDRWVYYLKEDAFSDNALINGSAGSTSSGASTALNALLKYGTPKFAVMGTGMNDGSDTDGHPTNLWINSRDAFITACQNNGIEPIFATIPTVPSVNNEAKNAWVKASGYRYIDFAKAVGADGTGAWYSGMLSDDNVHPTTKGAKALYTQVLIDLPEITISN